MCRATVLKFIWLWIGLTLTVGCSIQDDSKDKSQENNLRDPRFEVKCEIDEDRISKILQEEIPDQIACIKDNINLFMRLVSPDGPEYKDKLSRRALERYIKKNKPSLLETTKYFDLFFELSHLLFGDPIGYISKNNIDKLTIFLENFNREMAVIYPYLRDEDRGREAYRLHQVKSDRIEKAALSISSQLLKIFGENKPVNTQINYLELIDVFEKETNRESISKMKKLAYVKKAVLGGPSQFITQKELRTLVEKIPTLASVLYNLVRLDNIIFQNETNRFQMYSLTLAQFESLLNSDGLGSEVIISNEDLYETLKLFKKEIGLKDPEKYYEAIEIGKEILMGERGDVTAKGLYSLIGQLSSIVQQGLVFSYNYELYATELAKPDPVDAKVLKNPYLYSEDFVRYHHFEEFVKVARGFRFFKGDQSAPYFGNEYRRNAKGMIEAGFYHYLLDIAFRYFEKKYPCNDTRYFTGNSLCRKGEDYNGTLSTGQVEKIIFDLHNVLIDIDLVTPTLEAGTAGNVYLMTDLFQLQSNDDTWIGADEATEFVIQVLTATEMKKNIMSSMRENCQPIFADIDNDQKVDEMFDVLCFRKNFFKVLKTKFKTPDGKNEFTYGDYLPRLMKYHDTVVKQAGGVASMQYMVAKLETFARTCPDNKIPMSAGDIVSVFGGLFSIESTMIRFDKNKNNLMDAHEVEASWKHFKLAVENILRTTNPNHVDKALRVFQYLIKYKKIPTAKEMFWFITTDKHKWTSANRTTIATILATIKSQAGNQEPIEKHCRLIRSRLAN